MSERTEHALAPVCLRLLDRTATILVDYLTPLRCKKYMQICTPLGLINRFKVEAVGM